MQANDIEPLPSPLQVFSSRGGLSLLAHYLPTVYPEIPKTLLAHTETEKAAPVSDWVKVEPNDDIYEDLDNVSTDSSSKLPLNLSVPQHSLAAFGLFLRLPAYSDVLLRDKIRAQCLLRLVLGVTDSEGSESTNDNDHWNIGTLEFKYLLFISQMTFTVLHWPLLYQPYRLKYSVNC